MIIISIRRILSQLLPHSSGVQFKSKQQKPPNVFPNALSLESFRWNHFAQNVVLDMHDFMNNPDLMCHLT